VVQIHSPRPIIIGPITYRIRWHKSKVNESLVQDPGALYSKCIRGAKRGRNSNWFWLCSGSVAMVVLFGILDLLAQFSYWADIVKKLNDRLVEGSGHRDID
jgi:hypothetical protein